MWELFKAGGPLMWPILLCSAAAITIFVERLWSLRRDRVVPKHLVPQIWTDYKKGQLDSKYIDSLRQASALGRMLAAGLINREQSREIMKQSIEDAGRHVVHELERYLNTLGTIAAVTPLLGLLGTVFGMISVFFTITRVGVGDPGVLAGGISQALLTTAAGLSVAIPSLVFYRYLKGKVVEYVVEMERESIRLVDAIVATRPEASR